MSSDINIGDMVKIYLEANGYDGLYQSGECACKLDDLMPCGGPDMTECSAGVLTSCEECKDAESCEWKADGEAGWCIGLRKEEEGRGEAMIDGMKAHDIAHGMILEELVRAEELHPFWPIDVIHQAAIVGEEAGEVLKAAIDLHYKDEAEHPIIRAQHRRDLITELVQTGAMVHRMLDKIIQEEVEG
jgi:hypothetical protein